MAQKSNKLIYLIDSENFADANNLLSEIDVEDEVVLFYTECSKKQKLNLNIAVASQTQFVFCTNGTPNALDFQLATWLGNKIADCPKSKYIIVSNDHGFDVLCTYWKNRGISVQRQSKPTTKAKLAVCEKEYSPAPKNFTKNVIDLFLDKSLATEENYAKAYAAIKSGDKNQISKTVKSITNNKQHQKTMIVRWTKHIKTVKRKY